MRESLLDWLRCPECRGRYELCNPQMENGQVWVGQLKCECGSEYPIRDGVPRFVSEDQYVGNFSFQWNLHRRTQLDTTTFRPSHDAFLKKTGFELESMEGKLVLDLGVGAGRYADVVARAGATVVGIDLSYAVDAAQHNLGSRDNVHIIQADVFNLPFSPQTFDLIYSIGVLHHTPDCRAAFGKLPPLLKPNGQLAIWVYSAHLHPPGGVHETVSRAWRTMTSKLPPRVLYAVCCMLTPIYLLKRVPFSKFFKQFLHMLLPGFLYHCWPPTSNHKQYRQWLLDTFDWNSPLYQSKHTYPEVARWFREAGMTDIRLIDREVSVSGKMPSVQDACGETIGAEASSRPI